jgi:hypothetical protein
MGITGNIGVIGISEFNDSSGAVLGFLLDWFESCD